MILNATRMYLKPQYDGYMDMYYREDDLMRACDVEGTSRAVSCVATRRDKSLAASLSPPISTINEGGVAGVIFTAGGTRRRHLRVVFAPKAQMPWAPQARKNGEIGSGCPILSRTVSTRAPAQRLDEAASRR